MRCFFSLSSTSVAAPDLEDGHAAGELGETLLELLAVPVGVGALDLGRIWSMRPEISSASPWPSTIVVLSLRDDDLARLAEHVETDALELEADLLGDDLATGEDRDVLEHRLAAIAETGSLDRSGLEGAADLVDDERGESLALDVLGDDQRAACPTA